MSVQNLKVSAKPVQSTNLNAAAASFQSAATSEGAQVKNAKQIDRFPVGSPEREWLEGVTRNEMQMMKNVIFADPGRPNANAGFENSWGAADRLEGQAQFNSGNGKYLGQARQVIKDQIQSMMRWNPLDPENDRNRVAGNILMNALNTRGW